jgi:hypothetical protein
MELVNQTPAVAQLDVAIHDENQPRRGMLTAKVSFRIEPSGQVIVDDQDPFPLFAFEEPTELGPLPGDALPRSDDQLDVVLVAAAYARGGRAAESMHVGMSVGDVSRTMVVTGDRYWNTSGGRPTISRPIPFVRMPMTYAQAFGGRADVRIDLDTVIEVTDPFNPAGKGFDAVASGTSVAESLGVPEGFPRIDYLRMLPNLEHPEHRITRWEDAPAPYCWGTLSPDTPFAHAAFVQRIGLLGQASRDPFEDALLPKLAMNALTHRAHPDWVIDLPNPGARVTLTGVTPSGRLSFELPQVRILADYVIDDRTGVRELIPQTFVIMPEEMRAYIVYRLGFTVAADPESERSFRLRLEPGWFSPPSTNSRRGA